MPPLADLFIRMTYQRAVAAGKVDPVARHQKMEKAPFFPRPLLVWFRRIHESGEKVLILGGYGKPGRRLG